MTLIDHPNLSNLYGALGPDIRRRLQQLLANPARYWDRDHGIILRGDTLLTVWQAVLAVDPTFPRVGPSSDQRGRRIENWRRLPDQVLIARALKYAAAAPRKRIA